MSRLLTRLIAGLTFALSTAATHAAPTLTSVTPQFSFSFEEYLGISSIGNSMLGLNDKVFWIKEGSGFYNNVAVDSWFLIFEPLSDRAEGWLHFDGAIEAVFDSQGTLRASHDFESGVHSYDYQRLSIGLETGQDWVKTSGADLWLSWKAGIAGDHVRVLTQSLETPTAPIPEPSTYALMAGGLLAVLFMSRRRRQD